MSVIQAGSTTSIITFLSGLSIGLTLAAIPLRQLETENKQLKEHLDAECVCSEDYPPGEDPTRRAKKAAEAMPCLERGDCERAVGKAPILGGQGEE